MPIELLDDIIEELADRKGIYGSHGDELVDGDVTCTQKAPCRMCFTCGLRDRIIAAVEVERRLVQPPADTREPAEPPNALQRIYSIATRELAGPRNPAESYTDTGTLTAICTLIESGKPAEPAREWQLVPVNPNHYAGLVTSEERADYYMNEWPGTWKKQWRYPAGPWRDADTSAAEGTK